MDFSSMHSNVCAGLLTARATMEDNAWWLYLKVQFVIVNYYTGQRKWEQLKHRDNALGHQCFNSTGLVSNSLEEAAASTWSITRVGLRYAPPP